MMHQFGDKLINTEHVHAIGEPRDVSARLLVDLYFIGGKIQCLFECNEDEFIFKKNENGTGNTLGLYRTDSKIEWAVESGDWYFNNIEDTVIYSRCKEEIKKLKYLIESKQ